MLRIATVLVAITVWDMHWQPAVLSGRLRLRLSNRPTAKDCVLWHDHMRYDLALVDTIMHRVSSTSSTHPMDMPCTLSHRKKNTKRIHTHHDTWIQPLNRETCDVSVEPSKEVC